MNKMTTKKTPKESFASLFIVLFKSVMEKATESYFKKVSKRKEGHQPMVCDNS